MMKKNVKRNIMFLDLWPNMNLHAREVKWNVCSFNDASIRWRKVQQKRHCGKGSLRIRDSDETGGSASTRQQGLSRPENQEIPQHEFLDVAEPPGCTASSSAGWRGTPGAATRRTPRRLGCSPGRPAAPPPLPCTAPPAPPCSPPSARHRAPGRSLQVAVAGWP